MGVAFGLLNGKGMGMMIMGMGIAYCMCVPILFSVVTMQWQMRNDHKVY